MENTYKNIDELPHSKIVDILQRHEFSNLANYTKSPYYIQVSLKERFDNLEKDKKIAPLELIWVYNLYNQFNGHRDIKNKQ